MSSSRSAAAADPKSRPVRGTEHSWCKAVPGGTGITALALLLFKPPDFPLLQNALNKLQFSHPILRSKLHFTPASASFSFITPATPQLQIQTFDLESTSKVLRTVDPSPSVSPFHSILEHELNKNPWQNPDPSSDADLFFASVYTLQDETWVLAFRLHTSACDRTAIVALRRELLGLMVGAAGVEKESIGDGEVSLGIEDYIPRGQGNKPFWARGFDMLGYSLNSFRFSNLSFKDTVSPRGSCVIRLRLNEEETTGIMSKCKDREIKLCGLLSAAALMACHSINNVPDDQWEKYAVTTLIDCRSILDPVLSSDHIGFYHSAILNSHDVKGGENLWELAKRVYMSFMDTKNSKKHFTDMADLNFLMCKAIENPGLTASGSLRTAVLSVFEDPIIDDSSKLDDAVGLKDSIGCGSIHGVGPSIAIFDTIRDGKLDCSFVYPFPLHSKEQMREFVDEMKRYFLEDGFRGSGRV
ncbi:hypothetical protein F511_25660 [Dorcoceras hygrometricum]|uniref:Phthiocerol/phthiodiolone dimycocerosyl transferase C-terminal domain-containing protein n=1 Tax=Dorcoceras hygrometricum TaxID=472368 RepID=A0A2Z7AQE1_9LAMI|nr:hypothetical protein F511_25660 [Dorcoceras hygrometricum]